MTPSLNPSQDIGDFQPDLLIRPTIRRIEGPRGYLMRLAEANNMSFTELHKLSTKLDPAWLERNRLIPDEVQEPELHAHVLRMVWLVQTEKHIWNHQQARYCPLCLKDEPIWRASWEILFHDVCPHHGTWLIDQCHACHAPLTWPRRSLMQCQCGADLRSANPGNAPVSMRRLASILEARLLNARVLGEKAPLAGLTLRQVQRLIHYLGCHMDPFTERKPMMRGNMGSLSKSWPITSMAAEIVVQWPTAFHACLSKIQAAMPDEKAGLKDVFKQTYVYAYTWLADKEFAPVREAFELWAAEYWQGGLSRRNKRFPVEILQEVKWVPIRVAAQTTGVSMNQLRRLISHREIDAKESISETGRRFWMVRRDQLPAIEKDLGNQIPMEVAIALLGITKNRMRKIIRDLFPAITRAERDLGRPWRISKHEIDDLLKVGDDLEVISEMMENQVSFVHILKYWEWASAEIIELIRASQANTVRPIAKLEEGKGIAAWVFDRRQLDVWRTSIHKGPSPWLNVLEVAKEMCIHQEVAYWLAKNDYLRCERVGFGQAFRYRVHRKDMDALRGKIIFATEVAELLGCSARRAADILNQRGILPLERVHPGGPCRQRIYWRAAALERLVDELSGKPALTLT